MVRHSSAAWPGFVGPESLDRCVQPAAIGRRPVACGSRRGPIDGAADTSHSSTPGSAAGPAAPRGPDAPRRASFERSAGPPSSTSGGPRCGYRTPGREGPSVIARTARRHGSRRSRGRAAARAGGAAMVGTAESGLTRDAAGSRRRAIRRTGVDPRRVRHGRTSSARRASARRRHRAGVPPPASGRCPRPPRALAVPIRRRVPPGSSRCPAARPAATRRGRRQRAVEAPTSAERAHRRAVARGQSDARRRSTVWSTPPLRR